MPNSLRKIFLAVGYKVGIATGIKFSIPLFLLEGIDGIKSSPYIGVMAILTLTSTQPLKSISSTATLLPVFIQVLQS